MAEPHPVELRIRVVMAYEECVGSYPEVAARFGVGEASVKRWVQLRRRVGGVAPAARGGGTRFAHPMPRGFARRVEDPFAHDSWADPARALGWMGRGVAETR